MPCQATLVYDHLMFNLAVEQNTNIQLRAVELHDSPLTLELTGKHSLRLLGQFFLCTYNSNMLSVRTIDVLCSSLSPRNSVSSLHPLTPGGPNKWVEILSYAVSASGNYVATLSRPNRQLHVDLWEIGMPTAQKLGIRESKIAASMSLVFLSVDHEVSVSDRKRQFTAQMHFHWPLDNFFTFSTPTSPTLRRNRSQPHKICRNRRKRDATLYRISAVVAKSSTAVTANGSSPVMTRRLPFIRPRASGSNFILSTSISTISTVSPILTTSRASASLIMAMSSGDDHRGSF